MVTLASRLVVADITCWPSLDHLYFVFVCLGVGVPYSSDILLLESS